MNDYVNAGSQASLDNLTELTLSAWIKINATGQYDRIFSKNYLLRFEARNGVLYASRAYTVTQANTEAIGALSLNTWYYVTATYSESGDRKFHIYVNGVEKKYSLQNAGVGTLTSDAAGNLFLGAETGVAYLWDGLLDNIRIYNRALTAEEIGQLYRAGARKMKIDPTKGYKTIIQ